MRYRTFEDFVERTRERRIISEYVLQPDTRLKLYVRSAIMIPGGIELANVDLPSKLQRKGVFSAFLTKWETVIPLKLECVLNPELANHMRRRPEWITITSPEYVLSPDFGNTLWVKGMNANASSAICPFA